MHDAWGWTTRQAGWHSSGAVMCCHPAASVAKLHQGTVCPASWPLYITLHSLPTSVFGSGGTAFVLCCDLCPFFQVPWFCNISCLLLMPWLFSPISCIVHFLPSFVSQLQSHSAALSLSSVCSNAPCSAYQEFNKDLLPELPLAFINQKMQTACKQHSLPCMPSAAYWIHIPLPPASLSFFNMGFF